MKLICHLLQLVRGLFVTLRQNNEEYGKTDVTRRDSGKAGAADA